LTEQSIHALAQQLYRHPDTASVTMLEQVASVFEGSGVTAAVAEAAGRLLRFLLFTPVARESTSVAMRLLRTPGLEDFCYHALLRTLRYYASWCNTSIEFESVVTIAACAHMAPHRGFLLRYLVEPLVFADPSRAVPPLFGEESRYLLYLTGRGGSFPLHQRIHARLKTGSKRVLAVHNINDGQGDELVRCVPLLQSLLDFNPALEVIIVTRRLYLYDNPRVQPVSIHDEETIHKLLAREFDMVIDFFEPVVQSVNYVPELERRLQAHRRRKLPFLFLSALKGYNDFAYQTIAIEGRNHAPELGLDRPRTGNIYEPTLRLIAELGLPARIGQQRPRTACLLTGTSLPDADLLWESLVGSREGPVAIVNPFGGREPLKGYTTDQFPSLSNELAALVDEGFTVLLLPNGTPWGHAAAAAEVAASLGPDHRRHVVLAPDPGAASVNADHVMRCFKHFILCAELAVTVEGWMSHMAYLLGKPYRLVMLPYSHGFQWHPYPPSCRQGVIPAMAHGMAVPPAPRYPGKDQLLFVLGGLRLEKTEDAIAELLGALRSPDRDIRAAAARSLASHVHDRRAFDALLGALKDRSGPVRRAAAAAFLDRKIDLVRNLGQQYETILQCHCWIVEGQWKQVIAAGNVALYSVCVAMDDEDDVVRAEASWAFQELTSGKLSRSG
jgi:hypothetical protein